MEPVQLAAILAVAVVVASMLSVELGIAVALFELGLGVVAGNVFDLQSQEWLDFIAAFASIVLTFLAGLEVDPGDFRQRFGASVSIGLVSLSAIFIEPNAWFPVFLVGSVALVIVLPRAAPWFFRRYGDRVIEPEIKLVFVCLFGLMVLADASNGHAVLPAFVLGLAMSRHFAQHRTEQERIRVVAFAFLTPFFFMRGGLNVSLGAVFANFGILAVLLAAKMVPKLGLVLPLARRHMPRHATFATLLMSTGLTFGTISALFGLGAGIIDKTQFSLLITVVVASALIPTAIAQTFFHPIADLERHKRPIPPEEYVLARQLASAA